MVVATEHSFSDAEDVWHTRMNLVIDLLNSADDPGALAEVESWTYWQLDSVQLWLVGETLFRTGKKECVPVLERVLRDQEFRDPVGRQELERKAAIARTWTRRRP